jgi:hypothetical protein
MFVQFGAKLIGMVYLGFGIVGFLPINAINPIHHDGLGARYLLNLVAINALHNIIHLAVGISGIWAAKSLAAARLWGKLCGAVLLALFAAGMAQAFIEGLPRDQLFLGVLPLNSPGHVLHLVSGGVALYLGLVRVPAVE